MPGTLVELPAGSPAAADSPRYEGIFNLVANVDDRDQRKGPRRLPTLYFGKAPVFVDRSVDVVAEKLVRVAEIATVAWRQPTYLLQPCALGNRVGLYGRDLLNRSSYRSKLRRLGVEFPDDPFVTFSDDGRFKCRDWGSLEPSFVIARGSDEDPDKVLEATDALLAFRLATYRMGPINPSELKRLVGVCNGLESAAARNPEAVVAKLSH